MKAEGRYYGLLYLCDLWYVVWGEDRLGLNWQIYAGPYGTKKEARKQRNRLEGIEK